MNEEDVIGRDATSHGAECRIAALNTEVENLRRQLADRDAYVVTVEKQLASHVAEISVSYTIPAACMTSTCST